MSTKKTRRIKVKSHSRPYRPTKSPPRAANGRFKKKRKASSPRKRRPVQTKLF